MRNIIRSALLLVVLPGFVSCVTVSEPKKSLEPVAKMEKPVVTAQHMFNAPPARVWDVMTKTEYIKQWWGPNGFQGTVKKNDFKVGGRFLLGMEGPGFPMSWNTGVYTYILAQKQIKTKMTFADDKGRSVPAAKLGFPGQWDDFQEVTIDFREDNGQTFVKVTETGIPPEMSQPAAMGWVQQFDKIDKLLSR